MKTNPHFVCGAGQPDPHFARLSGQAYAGRVARFATLIKAQAHR